MNLKNSQVTGFFTAPVVALTVGLLAVTPAFSDKGVFETEPNDAPENFLPVSGAVTLYGTMVGADQDGYLWTVSDNDARKRWNFELIGEPGALTIVDVVRLEYDESGAQVIGKKSLMKMGTRDGVTPSIHENLLFEPGEYVIGLAHVGAGQPQSSGGSYRPPMAGLNFGQPEPENAGEEPAGSADAQPANAETGAYRFIISEGKPINPQPSPKGRDSSESAYSLRLRSEFTTFNDIDTAWYSLKFDKDATDVRWDVVVQAPLGRPLGVRLLDAGGKELLQGKVNDKGRLRLPDLAPTAGTIWHLALHTDSPGFIQVISTEQVGQRIAGEEAEPNNNRDTANRVDLSQPVTGRIGGDDTADNFIFNADESVADELRTLRVVTQPPVNIQVCLNSSSRGQAQCRNRLSPVELPDLSLFEDDWSIVLERAAEASYTMELVSQGPVQPGIEVEPNDTIEFATGVPDNMRIKGRFSGNETDFFQILVSGEPQLWRFQLIGDELFELGYYDGSKYQQQGIRAGAGQRRIRLDNVFLLPGQHYIRVAGNDGGTYTLLARALGPPDPNGEMEPNDEQNKQRLAIGQTRTGLSSDANDLDYYRFFVGNWDHLRLTIEPPVDGLLAPYVYWYGQMVGQGMPNEPGKPLVLQGLFPPGDYYVVIHPQQVSDAEYRISLERQPRFSCPSDCEPSGYGEIWLASPLPPNLVLKGETGEWRDIDLYEFPVFDHPVDLHIMSAEPLSLWIGLHVGMREYLTHDAAFGGYRTQVPAGGPYRLMVESSGAPYRLELVFPNGEIRAITEPLPVELDLTLDQHAVSAFRPNGQRVTGSLNLTNSTTASIEARLEAVTSDHRWQVALDSERVAVPANSSTRVPLEVLAPADAWADNPVRISVRAFEVAGRQVETWQEIAVEREIPALNPELYWAIPESLAGGFNAAWLPFGGEWTEETPDWAKRTDTLRDGLSFDGVQLGSPAVTGGWKESEHNELTIDLPGEEPLPVAGIAIDQFGSTTPFFNIREGTLLLSLDGANFEEALRFETLPVRTEQQFVLETPAPARFARLRIDSTFREPSTEIVLMTEWKVILEPGFDLSQGQGYNIADPVLGGHLVWDWPPEPYSPQHVLIPDDASRPAHTQRGPTKEYIIGFNQNRAAQITGIDWAYADDAREGTKVFRRIEAVVSLDSPVGPWQPLGALDIDPETMTGKLVLPEPTWARFVRLTANTDPGDSSPTAPGQIRIHERPQGDDYLSVLTEWGTLGWRAFYEFQRGLQIQGEMATGENTTRETAAPLQSQSPVSGQVALGKLTHWYRMAVPATQNTLIVSMDGDPTVRTIVELETAAGEVIPLRRNEAEIVPGHHEYEAIVEAGSEVYFHVLEPPRNVAFSWDTSSSVGAYIPQINNAIVAFSGQVVPGRERVNLFPFPTGPLLDEWLSEPYMLQTILNDYRRPSSSSSAEYTLNLAGRALAPLAGTKAMVVMTDGDVVHEGMMWEAMQQAQPRVFSIQVGGAAMLHQSLMRDWASVNGGDFSQLRYDGEMEVAFDRASTLMHRPAGYTLLVTSEFREAPGPGFLSVKPADKKMAGGAAVELILDASGSMLQRIEGKRRIVVAKEVLIEAVSEHIPVGTPVALRVFGHKEIDSCRTDLEIPLAPLNPQAAAAKIAGINAMNLARTPIAASLAAVETDLQGTRNAIIVLVTDGEETCDGDPGAVIQALRDKGFEVSLNIVGFAIDDVELAAQFKSWAELGGGRYLGASDQDGLSEAIEQALRISYVVYDQGGNEVALGEVGEEPIELERGVYRVVINTVPKQSFDKVEIAGEDEVSLQLK